MATVPLLRSPLGDEVRLPVGRFFNAADASDRALLATVTGPVLDVGCGPGRIPAALSADGVDALGIDISARVIDQARRNGAQATLCCALSGALPRVGEWETILLLDGNIGIGGNPVALISRFVQALSPTGFLLVELDPHHSGWESFMARFDFPSGLGPPFEWAIVGADGLGELCALAGCSFSEPFEISGRLFTKIHGR